MKDIIKYFPQGIATDISFCNRDQERSELKHSIEMHEHIVLVAPRRYGKTSLVMQVLQENSFPGACIDFFFVLTHNDVIKLLMEGISKIISQLLPTTKTTCLKLIESISALNPKLTFNFLGQTLEIATKQTTEKSISELLLALDQFAEKTQKSCVIILDEFQQIGELKENHAVEAAIRHAVERSRFVSYIFCGSKRHLLSEMFSNKSRPLYHLCDLMTIDRIHDDSYQLFLNKMAQNKWMQSLQDDVVQEIIHLSESHPYYVNALCRRLWRHDTPPSLSDIRNTWHDYVCQQQDWVSNDLVQLTLNRRKVLTALAVEPTHLFQGQAFSTNTGLTPSSINKCIADLRKLDLIYQDRSGYYRVLDPVISYFIRQNALKE